MKVATVSIIGRPSSGKSTLVNTICEMKVSITSPVPQTTRNKIRGIYTDQRGQLVFTDTPGFHISDKMLNKRMQDITLSALNDSDIILYLVDGSRKKGMEEEKIAELVKKASAPLVVAINKTDIANRETMSENEKFLKDYFDGLEPLKISALNDEGVDELLIELFKEAKEGELLYDKDTYTDQSLEFRISEIIREKAMDGLLDELPHVILVDIQDLEYSEEKKSIWVRAFVNVEREGQKGFLVGKNGENIKRIGSMARKEIKKIFPGCRVRLDLKVKVLDKWRTNPAMINKILDH